MLESEIQNSYSGYFMGTYRWVAKKLADSDHTSGVIDAFNDLTLAFLESSVTKIDECLARLERLFPLMQSLTQSPSQAFTTGTGLVASPFVLNLYREICRTNGRFYRNTFEHAAASADSRQRVVSLHDAIVAYPVAPHINNCVDAISGSEGALGELAACFCVWSALEAGVVPTHAVCGALVAKCEARPEFMVTWISVVCMSHQSVLRGAEAAEAESDRWAGLSELRHLLDHYSHAVERVGRDRTSESSES